MQRTNDEVCLDNGLLAEKVVHLESQIRALEANCARIPELELALSETTGALAREREQRDIETRQHSEDLARFNDTTA